MVNLMSAFQNVLSDNVVGKIASMIGSNNSATGSIINSLMPKVMKGIISKGSTESGASSLLSLIKNNKFGSDDLMQNLSGGSKSDDFLSAGAKANESIFGSALGSLTSGISGLSGGAGSKLMSILTPMVLGSIGKVVSSNNLDANGLKDYLASQGDGHVKGAMSTAHKETAAHTPKPSGGGGLLKWLLPLVLLLAALYFLFNKGKADGETAKATTTESVTTNTNTSTTTAATHTHADGTVHEGHAHGTATETTNSATQVVGDATNAVEDGAESAMTITVDAAGNLVRDGKILAKAGEFKEVDGQYVDMDGKKIGFIKKVGKAIGDAAGAVGGAVGGAATKTADAFKSVFGGMFKKKKDGGTVAAYSLSKIVFDPESNRITDYSKNEVMGLAEALKGNADAKINVEVYTNDGENDKKNKKLSNTRAEVVRDMLVTLGVNKKQISFDGKGSSDAAKAGMDKVEILVK